MRTLRTVSASAAAVALVLGILALLAGFTGPPTLANSSAPTSISSVGCSDGRGGVVPVSVSETNGGGDANCHSWDPRRQEQCARKICEAVGTGSTPLWWR